MGWTRAIGGYETWFRTVTPIAFAKGRKPGAGIKPGTLFSVREHPSLSEAKFAGQELLSG